MATTNAELRQAAVDGYVARHKTLRGYGPRARELRRFLLELPVISNRDERAWRRAKRHKAFWLRVGQSEKAHLVFVDGGCWAHVNGTSTVHVARMLKSERPSGLGIL